VNKESLITALKNYTCHTVQDAESIVALTKKFPFSQFLHALSAKVSDEHGLKNHSNVLQLAAVYAADRVVLKNIMTLSPEAMRKEEASSFVAGSLEMNEINENLADEVIVDLKRLSKLKQDFERLYSNSFEEKTPVMSVPEITEEVGPPIERECADDEAVPKSKKERIKALAKAYMQQADDPEQTETAKVKTSRRKREDSHTIIDEIASKEEILPAGERQKEQLQIIEHFIKIKPSIPNAKERAAATDDFDTIKTGEFGENIISETLVEILLKQGKKDKAIEVLKKLIWKFPQKKAYFAAQIEELKK
jgi:tetratricopeptide (TPR) repeat protein